ncbi:het domain protein [Diplodia corticola]|uniref:Het domain protein n=1 Tax=Diplodia corticola TaxID=236234 RepID=A0A1J9RWG5_9PEZI|nr:het domain protein [Diplodia corticola]OJD32180.1 het domain protein [Diplodia corticola]
MDHLLPFHDALYTPVEIPFLSSEPYECRNFWSESFHEARQQTSFQLYEPKERDQLLQNWLFFGILDEFLGPVDAADFVRHTESGPQITTENLVQRIVKWRQDFLEADGKTQEVVFRKNQKWLAEAIRIVLRHDAELEDAASPTPAIWLSVKVLVQTIMTYVRSPREIEAFERGYDLVALPPSSILNSQLRQAGWCPSDVARSPDLLNSFFTLTLNTKSRTKDHAQCSQTACNADQINEATYETSHVDAACKCAFVGPARSDILSILDSGKIPVVVLPHSLDGARSDIVLQAIPSKDSTGWIAISHVWSDGLGNAVENKLPLCQLRKLRRIALGLSRNPRPGDETRPVDIWIDTLCVPVGEEDKPYRKLAISRMARTYKEASIVVTLDAELLSASCLGSDETTMLRIRYSGWMRRLWTLQEAILPERECLIQFCDGTIPLFEFAAKLSKILDNFMWSGQLPPNPRTFDVVLGHWRTFEAFWKSNPARRREIFVQSDFLRRNRNVPYHGVSKLTWHREDAGQKLRSTWNAIVGRRTSKAEDESFVFAGLLYLVEEVKEMLELPLTERWKLAFSRLGNPYQIPQDIIFHSGPRPDQDGWRWITLSITETSSKLFSSRSRRVSRSAWKGLGVDLFGIHLDLSVGSIDADFLRRQPGSFHIREENSGRWYRCSLQPADLVEVVNQEGLGSSAAAKEGKARTPTGQVALVLHQREQFLSHHGPSDKSSRAIFDLERAILVEILDPETRNSRYICNVQLEAVDLSSSSTSEDSTENENRSHRPKIDAEGFPWTVGRITENEEHWVVG